MGAIATILIIHIVVLTTIISKKSILCFGKDFNMVNNKIQKYFGKAIVIHL